MATSCYFVVHYRFSLQHNWSLWKLCAAIRRDSVSLCRFIFLSHIYVFLCAISLRCRLKYLYSYFLLVSVSPCLVFSYLYIYSSIVIGCGNESLFALFNWVIVWVVVWMPRRNPQFWQSYSSIFFITYRLCYFLDVDPYASSATFFSLGLFAWVPPSSI